MPKKKTPDKEIDLIRHKTPYTTIKTSLKSVIRDQEINKEINKLVIRCNDIVIDSYQFIRLHCLYLYKHDKDIPKLDNTFIQYCIKTLGNRDNRGKKAIHDNLLTQLNTFYEGEYKPIFNHQKHDLTNLSFAIPYLSCTMETCINNNLKEHFIQRLFRFINISAGKYYDEHFNNTDIKIKKKSLWTLKKAIVERNEIPSEYNEWFNIHKDYLVPPIFNKSLAYDCKASPCKYIKYSFYMNGVYEQLNDEIRNKIKNETDKEKIKQLNSHIIRLFQPLSLRKNNVPHYIQIDTATLINVLSTKGSKGKLLTSIKDNQHKVWNKYFKLDKSIFKKNGYNFNYTIQTDGIGCSLSFITDSISNKKYGSRIKTEKNELHYVDDLSTTQFNNLTNKEIITADPGKKSLLYMANKKGNKLKYNCMQRDTESLAKRNRRIMKTNKEKSQIDKEESTLTTCLSTTINYDKFKEYIKVKHDVNVNTKEFYNQELYRKLKWRSQIYRRKSEDKFLNRIEETFGNKDNLVVVIGDWSNQNDIKGLSSTMGIGLKRMVQKKYTTLLIDEFNTSKKCCKCLKDIENKEINGVKKFRLQICKNCVNINFGCSKSKQKPELRYTRFINRDLNSCMNMHNIIDYMLSHDKKRPIEYTRESYLPSSVKKQKKVGKSVVFTEGKASDLLQNKHQIGV
jgi:hypothetical protein